MGYPAIERSRRRPTSTPCAPSARPRSTTRRPPRRARTAPAAKNAKAAAGTVRAQHADYWEDAGGRWLSIEGTTNAGRPVTPPRTYTGPQLVATWYDAAGTQIGTGNLQPYLDTDVTPVAPYLYHVSRFRLGDARTIGTPMPAVHPHRGAQRRRRADRRSRSGSATAPRSTRRASSRTSTRTTSIRRRATSGSRTWPRCTRTSRRSTTCRTRRRATSARRRPSWASRRSTPAPRTAAEPRPSRPRRSSLTSKALGQDGGNDVAIRLVNPGAGDEPLSVSVTGNVIRVNLATDGTGAITSTAEQVVDAINANPAAAALVTASQVPHQRGRRRRHRAAPQSRSATACSAPATYPRGPQTVKMLRIGKVRDGSKVGVFIYCQEHAREWGTPLVCLETAERLIRNYGTDPETTSADRQPRHLHHPDDQRRRRRVLDVRLQHPAPQHGQLLRVEPDGQQRPVRPQRLGRRPQPQLQRRLVLRRLPGRVELLHRRHVRRPVRALRARGPQRGLRAVDVPEHQVRDERALQRRLLHVASGRVQAHHA